MSKRYKTTIRICGGDFTPGDRDPCPNELHDWPLPNGYVDAGELAGKRLWQGWRNRKCPDCDIYGWKPPAGVEEGRRTWAEVHGAQGAMEPDLDRSSDVLSAEESR